MNGLITIFDSLRSQIYSKEIMSSKYDYDEEEDEQVSFYDNYGNGDNNDEYDHAEDHDEDHDGATYCNDDDDKVDYVDDESSSSSAHSPQQHSTAPTMTASFLITTK